MIRRTAAVICCIAMIFAGAFALKAAEPVSVFGEGAVPGSADDPVVTRSYVLSELDQTRDELKESMEILSIRMDGLDGRISALEPDESQSSQQSGKKSSKNDDDDPVVEAPSASSEESGASGPLVFTVVEVPEGGRLIGEMGTEMILRAGTAVAIDNGADGITDLTSGQDLKSGESVVRNHMLIIPRADGRGISCSTHCYVMVKGGYTIE